MSRNLINVLGLFVILGFGFTGCGGGGSSATDSSTGGSTSFQVTTSGAVAKSQDGNTTIEIPSGAINTTTTITIAPDESTQLPGGVTTVYDFQPNGLTFNVPIKITMKVDTTQLAPGTSISDLTIAYEADGELVDLPDPQVGLAANTITAQTTHFSKYVVKAKSAGTAYGTPLGAYNNIVSMSNGSSSKTYDFLGWEYECVEYVNRYYFEIYDYPSWKGSGNGADYFSVIPKTQKDITAYKNNGSVAPVPGDILVWGPSKQNLGSGHVAIIRTIQDYSVTVIQQNVKQTVEDAGYVLPMSTDDGKFNISSGIGPILGWLHTSREPNYVLISDEDVTINPFQPGAYSELHGSIDNTHVGNYNTVEGKGYLNGYLYAPTIPESTFDITKVVRKTSWIVPQHSGSQDLFVFIPESKVAKSKNAPYHVCIYNATLQYFEFQNCQTVLVDQSAVKDNTWKLLVQNMYLPEGWGINVTASNETNELGRYVIFDAVKSVAYPW